MKATTYTLTKNRPSQPIGIKGIVALLVLAGLLLTVPQQANAQAPYKGSELFVYHMVGTPPFANRYPACMKFVSFTHPSLYCPPPSEPPVDPPTPGGGGQSDQGGGLAFMDEEDAKAAAMAPLAPPPGGVFDAFDNDIIGLSFYNTNRACSWRGSAARLTVCPVAGSNTIINGFFFEYGVSMTGGGAAGVSSPTLRVLVNGVQVYTQSFLSSDRYNGFYAAFPASLNTTAWEGKNVTFEVTDVRERIIDDFAIIGTNNCSANSVCLGNLVWEDTNNDGIKDAAEPVKAGVTIQVFRDDNDGILKMPTRDYLFEDGRDGLIAETTTDANGNYNVCLPAGSYFVRIPPSNFDSGKPLYQCFPTLGASVAGNSDIDNQDHTNATSKVAYKAQGMISSLVTLTAGGEPTNDGNDANTNSTIDFGVVCDPALLMSLGNLVWEDTNKDGLKDASEMGIDDVNLELYVDANANGNYDANDVLAATTTTSGGGLYNFTGLLPGDYIVVVPENNYQPLYGSLLGYVPSPGRDPATDPDDNLDNDDNGIPSGNYKIVTQAVTLAFTTEPTGDGDGNNGNLTVDIAVYSDGSGACSEYGFSRFETGSSATHDNMQFYDANGTFQRYIDVSADYSGGQMWYDEGSNKISYTSNSKISGSSIHRVRRVFPAQVFSKSETGADYFQMMEQPVRDIYGNYYAREAGTLFRIYLDELPTFIEQTVAVTGALTGADLTYNNTDGNYRIFSNKVFDRKNNLYMKAAGTGVVRFSYNIATSKWLGASSIEAGTNVTAHRKTMMYDPKSKKIFYFGSDRLIYSLPEEFTAGTNATQEISVVDIPNAIIQSQFDARSRKIVVLASTTVATTRKAYIYDVSNTGVVTFRTSFNLPSAFNTTGQLMEQILIVPCGGLVNPPSGIELKLGNVVWKDDDNDGIKDATEAGIANVGIVLYKDSNGDGLLDRLTDMRWDSTTTDASGYYLFEKLPEGDYFAWIPNSNFSASRALNGMYSSTPSIADPNTNIDNDDNGINPVMPRSHINDGVTSGKITLSNTAEPINDGDDANGNMTLDFGFYLPQPGVDNVLRLGNRVWEDANNNIKIDAGEVFFDGVTLTLLRDNGDLLFDATEDAVIAMTTTGGGGFYLFDNLLPGNYYVRVDKQNFDAGQPLHKFRSSTGYYGANTCFDSVDKGNESAFYWWTDGILTSYISMEPGEEPPMDVDGDDQNGNMIMDFGFYRPVRLGNRVWKDTDKDGIRDASEMDINEVMVNVYKDNGNGIFNVNEDTYMSSRVTQDSGYYNFHDLIAGSYFVQIPASNFFNGEALYELVSSVGAVGENPATNDGDHGEDNPMPLDGGITSRLITLAYDTEPAAAKDSDSEDGNFTIDFGFIEPPCILPSGVTISQSAPTCTGATANNNGSISLTAHTGGTHYGVSAINAGSYNGPTTVATATAIPGALPAVLQGSIPNTGGSYIIRIFNSEDDCYIDQTVTVNPVVCVPACTSPSGYVFTQTAPGCVSGIPENNGAVVLTSINSSTTHYGVSTLNAASYNGPTTIAAATPTPIVPGFLPHTMISGISNTGGTYRIRFFNNADNCYVDEVVTINPVVCEPPCVPPTHPTLTQIEPGCVSGTAQNNGTIALASIFDATHYGVSALNAASYNGPTTVATATAIPGALPVTLITGVPNTGGTYRIRFFNGDDDCYIDEVVTVAAKPCTAGCTTPSDIVFNVQPPTCTGSRTNNNGTVALLSVTNGTHYGFSSFNAASYDGPAFASASGIPASLPATIRINVPNQTGTYQVRIYNGSNDCYVTRTVKITAIRCDPRLPVGGGSFSAKPATCTGGTGNDNGIIALNSVNNGTHYGVSTRNAGAYNGPVFGAATSLPDSAPVNVLTTVPNVGGTYIIRIFNGAESVYRDYTVTVAANLCPSGCTSPTGIAFTQVAATCTGATANNNGTLSLSAQTGGTHYGISTLNAATYDGAAYGAATPMPALPAVIQGSIPNTGGTYIVRVYNASGCYSDETVTISAVNCTCTTPSAIMTTVQAPTCTGASVQNNGIVTYKA